MYRFSGRVAYDDALSEMELLRLNAPAIWFLEHFSCYSLGNRGRVDEINNMYDLPVCQSARGGRVTYHGPGQLVIYIMMNIKAIGINPYVRWLEMIIIKVLSELGIEGSRTDQPGIWVNGRKIAFIGIRVQKWVTSHGISLNIDPDLKYFDPIIPCGVEKMPITSLKALGCCADRVQIEALFQKVINEHIHELSYCNQTSFG